MDHFCFRYETQTTYNHLNVQSLTVKMATQSTVILLMEQHLVEVMIFTSVTTPTLTKTHIATLVTHINLHLDISITLNKPSHCLLEVIGSHQQKLKYFTE